jgi:ribose-phosphate pyrophosphokinase
MVEITQTKEQKMVKIFTGTAHPKLAERVCDYLHQPLNVMNNIRFTDGEIKMWPGENVRGMDCYLIQPTNPPADNIMELLIMIDALKRASANTVNVIMPYYGYSRQDRKSQSREPITSKLIADILTVAGATRALTLDLHANQIQGFFNIPFDNLTAMLLFRDYYKKLGIKNPVAISDIGGVKRANLFANGMSGTVAILAKNRPRPDVVESQYFIGDVEGKDVIFVDDIIQTGGTMITAANEAHKHGAKRIFACATHGFFGGNAIEKIEESPIIECVITDTINVSEEITKSEKIKVISVAPLIGEAIIRIRDHRSISELFGTSV